MTGKALVRVYAQIGDNVLLHHLGGGEVSSHTEVAQMLREIANTYELLKPEERPPLGTGS